MRDCDESLVNFGHLCKVGAKTGRGFWATEVKCERAEATQLFMLLPEKLVKNASVRNRDNSVPKARA